MNVFQYILTAVKAAGPTVIPPILAELEKLDATVTDPFEKLSLEAAIAWLKSHLPPEPAPSA